MSNIIGGLLVIGVIIGGAAMLVLVLNAMGVDASNKPLPTETAYRAACDSVRGLVVWNGRQWECLK